jgi:hypothetical protein
VPITEPGSVFIGAVGSAVASTSSAGGGSLRTSWAMPKSRIFTRPSVVRKMFSGLRSRWMIPFACAAARPSAMPAPISAALRHAIGPALMRLRSVSPSSSSVTLYAAPPSEP